MFIEASIASEPLIYWISVNQKGMTSMKYTVPTLEALQSKEPTEFPNLFLAKHKSNRETFKVDTQTSK